MDLKSKIVNMIKYPWTPLIILGTVLLCGIYVHFRSLDHAWKLSDLYDAIDTSSSVALSLFAIAGFVQYTLQKNKKKLYSRQLDRTSKRKTKNGALVIRMGGTGWIEEAKTFAKKHVEDPDLIVSKDFGPTIERDDMFDLEQFLEKSKETLVHVERIEVIYIGIGVGLACIADYLSNWKQVNYYHFDKDGDYTLWYSNQKHRDKEPRAFMELHHATELKSLNTTDSVV